MLAYNAAAAEFQLLATRHTTDLRRTFPNVHFAYGCRLDEPKHLLSHIFYVDFNSRNRSKQEVHRREISIRKRVALPFELSRAGTEAP
ncbi:hypothetical protein EVAR_13125_1 [Eumeta japonica]|uniref:Uncharacterized protein n=1 Tax=Eumeta variegata TaxID=151549 RepID=A0A4C1U9M3_EUMVA|nr:hypothetical protein EVAR_13125_1 [Eumeta japonica]